MKRFLRLFLGFVLLAALVGVLNHPARACTCIQPDVHTEIGDSSAIFTGRVVGAKQQITETGPVGKPVTYDVGEIEFEVDEAFRGAKVGERVTIHSGTGGADCGYWFLRGERYLVYAFGDDRAGYVTTICNRTSILGHTQPDWDIKPEEDLKYLRKVFKEKPGAGLVGEFRKTTNAGLDDLKLPNVRVFLRDMQNRVVQETRSDAEGRFAFKRVPAGLYTVTADLPGEKYEQSLRGNTIRLYDHGSRFVLLLVKILPP